MKVNKYLIYLIFCAIFSACARQQESALIITPPDFTPPPIKVDATYNMVKNFHPGAYFDPAIDIDKAARDYIAQSTIQRLLFHIEKWRKTPYKLGGTSHLKGADCSAFTQQVFAQAFGIFLPRSTVLQRRDQAGKKVARNKLRTGDLLFFRTGGPNGLHVGIYLENGEFIHMSEHGGARVQNLRMNYWSSRYLDARRFIK